MDMEKQDDTGVITLWAVVAEVCAIMLFRLFGFDWLTPKGDLLVGTLLCLGMGVAGFFLFVCAFVWLGETVQWAWQLVKKRAAERKYRAWPYRQRALDRANTTHSTGCQHFETDMTQACCAIALLSILLLMEAAWLILCSVTSGYEKNPEEEASLASSLKDFSLGTSFSPVYGRELDKLQRVVILTNHLLISDQHWFVPKHRRAQSIDEATVVVCLLVDKVEHEIYSIREGGHNYKLFVLCYRIDAYFLEEGLTQHEDIADTGSREGWPNVQTVIDNSNQWTKRALASTLGLCYNKWDEAGFFYPEKCLLSSLTGSCGNARRLFACAIVTTLAGLAALCSIILPKIWTTG